MFATILNDFGDAISLVINVNNWVMLVAMLVISLFTGLRMGGYGHIFGAMFESVLLLGIFNYLYTWLSAPNRFDFDVWEGQTILSWNNLMSMTGMMLIGYLAIFFLLISAVFLIKALADRD